MSPGREKKRTQERQGVLSKSAECLQTLEMKSGEGKGSQDILKDQGAACVVGKEAEVSGRQGWGRQSG